MPDNNLAGLKKRIVAAQQTRKITRTMELIASSRLQRSRGWLTAYQAWAEQMREAACYLPDSAFAPPPDRRPLGRDAYVVFGGKKGLSGAYSPNLLQYARPITEGHLILTIGSAAAELFAASRAAFGDDLPSPDFAAAVTRAARELYDSGEADRVFLLYTRGTKQVTRRLFPPERPGLPPGDILLEPSGEALFPVLLIMYTESLVHEAHLQAFIAEQVSRVSAMDSATRNAREIIDALQANYNRIRQTSITQEIIMVGKAAPPSP